MRFLSLLPLNRDSRSHTTPFKRFKASHQEEDEGTSTTSATTSALPGNGSNGGGASAGGYIAFSDLNRTGYTTHHHDHHNQEQQAQQSVFSPTKPTFVSGSVFSNRNNNDVTSSPAAALRSPAVVPASSIMNQARSYLGAMMGSPANTTTADATSSASKAPAMSSGRVLNNVTGTGNYSNHAATTTPGQLYRPNYTSSSAAYGTTNTTNTSNHANSGSGSGSATHHASTPVTTTNGNTKNSSVKREYGYNDASREAKGSPDDLIDLTD